MKVLLLCIGLTTGISFPSGELYAQKKTLSLLVGGGIAYVHSKGHPVSYDSSIINIFQDYAAVLTPRIDIHLDVPVTAKVLFETGLGYQQKGYKSSFGFDNSEKTFQSSFESVTTTRIHYLRIPVTVGYTLYRTRTSSVSAGIGMDYGFALKAKTKGYFQNSYPSTGEVSKTEYENENQIKLLAGDNRLANYKDYWAEFFLFDAAFTSYLQYTHNERYIFRVFHSASLHPHIARESTNATSRLRYSGISIGYRF